MTALDIIRRSLRMSGGMNPGELPHADENVDALLVMNSMIDAWNTNRMNVYYILRSVHALVALQPSYTIGATGDFNVARPVWIERASVQAENPTGATEYPLKMLRNEEEWQAVYRKDASAAQPYALYNNAAYPLSTLYLYPVPSADQSLVLYSWEGLSGFAATSTVVTFPPGYADAIAYNLGVRIAVEWGRELRNAGEVKRLAKETLSAIQAKNAPAPVMRCDPAYLGSGNAGGPHPFWRMFQP